MNNMIRKVFLFSIFFLIILSTLGLQAAVGFHVKNGRLYDVYNNEFVIYGVSHAHTWYTYRTETAIPDIKSIGANAVRIVLSAGKHGEGWIKNDATDVQNVVNLCKSNKLIAVLECHDTTGYGEKAGAVPLTTAVSYWIELKPVLTGQEAYVIINIGNEPYGNTNASDWINATINAIQALRNAGFEHTLMVDAPNWGQDWEHIMLNNAQKIYNADTSGNLILSIHMYGVYKTASIVSSYVSTIKNQNLPLVIGEFGWNHSDGDPDEAAIMYNAALYNTGYMAWSWSGNGGGVEYLDMATSFDVNSITDWGKIVIDGPNGLHSRARVCSVFTNGVAQPTPGSPDPTPRPPSAGSCVNIPEWDADTVYSQAGTKVKYHNLVYQNNWYSKGENPELYSDVNQVWTFLGICDEAGPTPTPTKTPVKTPTPTPTATCSLLGDVNGDGVVNIVDALILAQYTVQIYNPDLNLTCADVDRSGSVDIVDALKIAQYSVGIIISF